MGNEQHIDVGDGVQYHVIGSAHVDDKSTAHMGTIKAEQLKFHEAPNGGFATISFSKNGMVVKHMDGNGKLLYTAPSIPPRGSAPPPTPTPSPVPSGSWECKTNKSGKIGTDTN